MNRIWKALILVSLLAHLAHFAAQTYIVTTVVEHLASQLALSNRISSDQQMLRREVHNLGPQSRTSEEH
jgi:hypothetical protein